LLDFESDAACGIGDTAENTVSRLQERCDEQLRLSIPYFGIIKIGADGVTKQWPVQQPPVSVLSDAGLSVDSVHGNNNLFSGFGQMLNQNDSSNLLLPVPDEQQLRNPQIALTSADKSFRQQHPVPAASVNDWAFQGVDAAFFDALMRGTGDWEQTL
jgi:hypothetical protein